MVCCIHGEQIVETQGMDELGSPAALYSMIELLCKGLGCLDAMEGLECDGRC